MDGVLVDTGRFHLQSWADILIAAGHAFDEAIFKRTFGMNNHGVLSTGFGRPPSQEELVELADRKEALFREAVQVFGSVHGLVNNAGMSPYQEFRDLSYNHLCQILALNIRSVSELCYLFMPHMLEHGAPSHVVNVSSVAGYAPLPRFSVYTGSKHYLRAFTNLLNYEYRGTNIQVSGLYPGGTLTEFPVLAGQRIKKFALKSMMTPEQVAEVAYPAILKGRRVILPGTINQLAALAGKLLPFPLAIRLMKLVYDRSMEPMPPTYPS